MSDDWDKKADEAARKALSNAEVLVLVASVGGELMLLYRGDDWQTSGLVQFAEAHLRLSMLKRSKEITREKKAAATEGGGDAPND